MLGISISSLNIFTFISLNSRNILGRHTIINEYRSAVPTAKGKFSCKAILICISKIFKKLQVFKICSNGTVHNYKLENILIVATSFLHSRIKSFSTYISILTLISSNIICMFVYKGFSSLCCNC